jgi:hypothetical protein
MMTHINDNNNHLHKPTPVPVPMTDPPPTKPHRRCRRRTVSSKEASNNKGRNHKSACTLPILLSLRVPTTLPKSWLVSTSTQLLLNPQEESSTTTTATSPHALARRLIPKLIQCDTELPSKIASSYQLWMSIRMY